MRIEVSTFVIVDTIGEAMEIERRQHRCRIQKMSMMCREALKLRGSVAGISRRHSVLKSFHTPELLMHFT